MKKLLSIAVALLATSMAWAQPQTPPSDPEYVSDVDVICSYSNTCPWYGAASSYTYPGTEITLKYMHFNVTQGSGSARQWEGSNNFSANEKEYVHLEIYPMADVNLTLDFPTGGSQTVVAELKANQWNSLNYDLADFGVTDLSAVSNLRFRSFESDADFYVDNYYYHHGEKYSGPLAPPGDREYNSDQDIICSATGATIWFGGYSSATVEGYTYPGTSTEIKYMHMIMPKNGYTKNTTEYDFSANEQEFIHFEIWTQTDATISLKLAAKSNGTDLTVNLTGGQWNSFDYDLVADLGATTLNGVGMVRFKALSDNGADIYVDNYYFHHKEAPQGPKLVIGETDADGITMVTGPITLETVAAFLEEIKDEKYKDVVFYDLENADYSAFPGEGAFTTRWTAANPNAVFGIKWVSETYKNRFVDKTNVGFAVTTNKKFYPFGNVELVDGYDIIHPTCIIGSVPSGCSVTYKRESSDAFSTLLSPVQADVPEGIKVYEADGEVSDGTLKFKAATTIEAWKPYIVKGNTFTLTAKEVLKIQNPVPVEVAIGGETILTGTFQAVTPADPVLTLQPEGDKLVFKPESGQVSPFRAFIKGAATDAITVTGDELTTGIETIDHSPFLDEPSGKAERTIDHYYDLQGRQIVNSKSVNSKLQRGVFVINGRKVVK